MGLLAPTGGNPDARVAVVIPTRGSPYPIVRLPARPQPQKCASVRGTSGLAAIRPLLVSVGASTLSHAAPLGAGDGVAITLEPASGGRLGTTQLVLTLENI